MRMGRPQEYRVQAVTKIEVLDVTALAANEARVLLPVNRPTCTDRTENVAIHDLPSRELMLLVEHLFGTS
jgi:hypothetical protein